MYPAGHNIIIYNIDEKQQQTISGRSLLLIGVGIEGSEGITALTVSPGKKYLAVCERSSVRAVCSIYDLSNLRRKRVLSSEEHKQSAEFISCNFSPTNEKSQLVTLVS